MKRNIVLSLLTFVALVGASLAFTRSASSSSTNQRIAVPRAVRETSNLMLLPTTLDVDRTDDTAGATACTAAPNDCSLRGAIIAANADLGADPVTINLQPATTYNLDLANATQENAAVTGDLDITTILHTVTIAGGGSSGANATTIDAAGLTTGSSTDRAFQITASGVTVTFQDLVIQNGAAADDGTSGASTNPTAQNSNRFGGGILNNGGSLTLNNVVVQLCVALGKGDTVINNHTTLDALGGGLASLATTGNVVITDSTLTANVAAGGNGGDFNNGAGSNAKGGSIYFEGGTLNISGSRIENSAASGGNGGSQDQNGQTNGGFGGTAQGGGVYVGGGTATINNTTFESTVAHGGSSGTGGNASNPGGGADGGGLYSLGNATVTNSTFHFALATGGDGGDAFGSTCLGGHQAGDGGGARGGAIFADGGSLTINTATFANNIATGGNGGSGGQTDGGLNCGNHGAGGLAHGGAIANNNAATVNIKHGTISENNAHAGNTGFNQDGANKPARLEAEGTGGGIRVGPGNVTLENTIIAGNTAANGTGNSTGAPTPGPNVDGAVTSNGHNLLGTATEATGFTGTGDQTGADPMLEPLADNDGPTQTMALSPGSPAIDAGVASGSSFDQRGKSRTYDDPGVANAATSDGTDIGAFELQPNCTLSCPGDITVSNDADQCGAVVNYTEPSGDFCGTITCDHPSGSFFAVGDTLVTCTSSAGPTCSFNVTVADAQNPTITAPAGFTVGTDSTSCSATGVSLGTPTTGDNCLVSSVTNNAPASFPLGSTTVTWTVEDNHGHTATATQVITVVDNTPPNLTVPANSSVSANSSCQALIPNVVSGSSASDNCGGVTVTQSPTAGTVVGLGSHPITVTATDTAGNHTSKTVLFTVVDTTPPTITLNGLTILIDHFVIVINGQTVTVNGQSHTITGKSFTLCGVPITLNGQTIIVNGQSYTFNGQVITLWLPNHEYQTVKVSDLVASASDGCDAGVDLSDVVISQVTSDELDNAPGNGDGNTVNDIVIASNCKSVKLRAERDSNLNGRVYTITFKVRDASGNVTTKQSKVRIPKLPILVAVDDGPHYTVTSSCP